MTPTLTALNGFLLLLAWQGQSGITYTVQTSENLRDWLTLPYVFSGELQELSVTLETLTSPIFARLRMSAEGDTNENGLPDVWEWERFGFVDVDPGADPDGDGMSTYIEWLNRSDPLDYFNGSHPVIRLASGTQWTIPTNTVSGQALALSLTRSTGEPWRNAPVLFQLENGQSRLLQVDESPDKAVAEVIVYTDALGRIDPSSRALHVLGASASGAIDTVRISAGRANVNLLIRTIDGQANEPPRGVRWQELADGSIEFSWRGDPSEAQAFLVEQLSVSGDWIPVVDIPASNLPTPDLITGRFQLTMENL